MNTENPIRANWPFPAVSQQPSSCCADPRSDCMGALVPGIGDKCKALTETAPGVFDVPGLETNSSQQSSVDADGEGSSESSPERWCIVSDDDFHDIQDDETGQQIAQVCRIDFEPYAERIAHLIKAAPLLRQALRDLVGEKQPLGIERPVYQAALAALAAAEVPT